MSGGAGKVAADIENGQENLVFVSRMVVFGFGELNACIVGLVALDRGLRVLTLVLGLVLGRERLPGVVRQPHQGSKL